MYIREDPAPTSISAKWWILATNVVNAFVSFVAALSISIFAFGNPNHFSKSWWDSLVADPLRLIGAITCSVSSLAINTILNYRVIPKAFKMAYDRLKNFCGSWATNTIITLLAVGAAVAAAVVGAAALSALSTVWAGINAGFSGFIFLVTRIYGLVNLFQRLDRWWAGDKWRNNQGQYIRQLTYLKKEYITELNTFIAESTRGKNALDEQTVTKILTKLLNIIDLHPDAVNEKSKSEHAWEALTAILATAGALAISTPFAQKFANGCDEVGVGHFNSFANMLFSLATPALYAGQIYALKETLTSFYNTYNDPNVSACDKIKAGFKFFLLIVGNGLASTGLYNLAESSATDPKHPFLYSDVTPTPETSGATAWEVSAGFSAGLVNLNITTEAVFAQAGPPFTIHHVVDWLKSNKLSEISCESLKREKARLKASAAALVNSPLGFHATPPSRLPFTPSSVAGSTLRACG